MYESEILTDREASGTVDLSDFVDRIICGEAVDVMKQIPDGSIDLIVTSPPYNLKNSTGNGMRDGRGGKWSNASLIEGYSHHNDEMPHDEFFPFLQSECSLVSNCHRIFYFRSDAYGR